jgi:hypothetical protein
MNGSGPKVLTAIALLFLQFFAVGVAGPNPGCRLVDGLCPHGRTGHPPLQKAPVRVEIEMESGS